MIVGSKKSGVHSPESIALLQSRKAGKRVLPLVEKERRVETDQTWI